MDSQGFETAEVSPTSTQRRGARTGRSGYQPDASTRAFGCAQTTAALPGATERPL